LEKHQSEIEVAVGLICFKSLESFQYWPKSELRILATKLGHRAAMIPWLNGIGIVVLFVALRWNNFDAPLVRDEGEYAYAAQILTHGIPPREFLQYLEQLLSGGYERIGGFIDEGAHATWKEPLSDEDLATSELVLYKRKSSNKL
jgi:hypothetical protein